MIFVLFFRIFQGNTNVGVQRSRCLHRLLCTDYTDSAIQRLQSDPLDEIQSTRDMSFSSQETDAILQKFNRSSHVELMEIQCISKNGANAIVKHRHAHGDFSSVDDLLKLACFKYLPHKRLIDMFRSILSPTDKKSQRQEIAEKLVTQFSAEETEVILDIFNTGSISELTQINSISSSAAHSIVKQRGEGGVFRNLSDLLEVPFSSRTVNKIPVICHSILAMNSDMQGDVSLSMSPEDRQTILNELNTLSSKELFGKNLGGSLHETIVEYREVHGPFEHIEDLNKVPGVGRKKLKWICYLFGAQRGTSDEFTFSPEETEIILDKLNNSSDEELRKLKYVSKDRASAIIRHRPFTNVDELDLFRNLGTKRYHELLRSVLGPDAKATDVDTSKQLRVDTTGTKSGYQGPDAKAADVDTSKQLRVDTTGTKIGFQYRKVKTKSTHVELDRNAKKVTIADFLKLSAEETKMVLRKLNASPAFELMQLKSITRETANSIVTHRREHGSFASMDDVLHFLNSDRKKLYRMCQNIVSTGNTISVPLDLNISEVDAQSILDVFNTNSQEELADKKLGKQLSELIVKYREQYGLFESVEDLLAVQKVGVKKLKQICKSIISPTVKPVSVYVHSKERLQVSVYLSILFYFPLCFVIP